MNRTAVFSLALTLALVGCADPVTQLVVVVDTDLMVPEQINQIRISTNRASADVAEQFDFGVYPVDAASVPLTLGVLVPAQLQGPDGMPMTDEPLRVRLQVTATGPSDRDRVVTSVEAEYVDGLSLEVPIFVAGLCRRVMCPMGQSCGEEGCVPIADLTPAQVPYQGETETLVTLPPTPMMPEE